MKIYQLKRPYQDCAAVAPINEREYVTCEICNYILNYPKPDLRIVEWLEGSDQVCDFIWPARLVAEVLVTESVRQTLKDSGAEFLPVEFWQDPKLTQPIRITSRTKRRIWLPYEGPPLSLMWFPRWVSAEMIQSTLSVTDECSVCGNMVYKAEGVEVRRSRWDASQRILVEEHTPRVKGKGIFVHYKEIDKFGLFRLKEIPGMILCTEMVKARIEANRLSNVMLLEVGSVFE